MNARGLKFNIEVLSNLMIHVLVMVQTYMYVLVSVNGNIRPGKRFFLLVLDTICICVDAACSVWMQSSDL